MSVATGIRPDVSSAVAASRVVVVSYPDYAQAQRDVDHLADSAFPVEHTAIVGHDLTLVEQVTGRMTKPRATAMGAGAGAWWGLFIGLLIGLFTTGPVWVSLILAGLVIGAIWGAVFGFVAQWATHGQRDFASASDLVAARYDVTVDPGFADRARQLLSSMH